LYELFSTSLGFYTVFDEK